MNPSNDCSSQHPVWLKTETRESWAVLYGIIVENRGSVFFPITKEKITHTSSTNNHLHSQTI